MPRLSALNEVDAKLRRWYEYLPSPFSELVRADTAEATMPAHDADSVTRLSVLILQVVYHQCICALHASIVPLFSLGPALPFSPYSYSQRVSTQIAYEHACEISDVVHGALSRFADDAFRWSGFVGYALYCSCAIQLPFLWSVEPAVAENARRNIKFNLETMAKIGRNWPYVLNLGLHVRSLYQYHSTEPVVLPAHIQHFSAADLSGKGRTQSDSRPVLGQHEMVWDLQRTLARGEAMKVDQGRSPDHIEKCKELIESEAPSSGKASHLFLHLGQPV
jgi:hypothetical protein